MSRFQQKITNRVGEERGIGEKGDIRSTPESDIDIEDIK